MGKTVFELKISKKQYFVLFLFIFSFKKILGSNFVSGADFKNVK